MTIELKSLHIPASLRGFESEASVFDVMLDGPHVARVRPSTAPAQGLLISGMVDAHVHIDKNYTLEHVGAAEGNLFAAIQRSAAYRAHWTAPDVRQRMERALAEAWAHGTRALRTHLDWPERNKPLSLAVFESLRDEWAGRLDLQCVSLTPLDMYDDAFVGEDIALEVARVNRDSAASGKGAAALLGAFCYRNERIYDKLQRVFDLAIKNGLSIDFHVDEGLHADARGLRAIAELTIQNGWQGKVTCGHCCSLSMQPLDEARQTLALCAQAGIHVVAMPTTNLYLQGSWTETPLERGITRVKEARAGAVSCCIATDNVADAFFPYGSYDLLESFGLGVQVAHLAPAAEWLDAITVNPARALGLAWDGRIAEGCPADLVLLAARSGYELLTPTGRTRKVYRAGVQQRAGQQVRSHA